MRALATNTSEHFSYVVEQVRVVDGFNQFYLTKVPWTVNLRSATCLAESVFVHRAHEVIIDAVSDGVTVLFVGALVVYDLDSLSVDLLTAEDGQSKSVHFVKRHIRVFQCVLHLY